MFYFCFALRLYITIIAFAVIRVISAVFLKEIVAWFQQIFYLTLVCRALHVKG